MTAIRVWILFCAFAAAASFAQETNPLPTTITIDGVTYSNISWRTVTPATVSIFHQTGVTSIPLKELPPDLQKRFEYDPQKAADYNSADAAVQAQWAERTAAAKGAQKMLQLQQAAQQEYAASQNQPPPPVDQPQPTRVVPLNFISVEFQLPSNGVNGAILTLTSGQKASVEYNTDGETFLNRCSAQRAVWEQQEHNLAQSSASYSSLVPQQQMWYSHVAKTFVVYGAQLDASTYKLVGNATYQQMGGAVSYIWR